MSLVLYTQPRCGYCDILKEKLDKIGEKYYTIDITKHDRIILGKYIPNGSGKLASLAAIDRDARKNQKTIIELKALITTSSPFQELLSDNNFILLKRNRLKTNPKNVPITTIPISVTIFICKNSI